MSAPTTPRSPRRAETRRERHDYEGSGWVMFAGIMLAILGAANIIYGIGAIDDANVFVGNAHYVVSDLKTWGWFILIVGAVQAFGAFAIFSHSPWGQWIGIGSAGLNSILQLLFMPAFPFLSMTLFAVDILVIYALIAYGGRQEA